MESVCSMKGEEKINWGRQKIQNGRNRPHCKEDGKEADSISYNGILKPFYLKFKMRLDQIKLCETQRVNRIIA